jgi:chromosome segregation ATPase
MRKAKRRPAAEPESEHQLLETRVSSLDEPMEEPSMEHTGTEHTGTPETIPSFLKDEVAPILAAAERAAAQIIDRAREQARHDTESLERSRKQVETRITELVAWQEHVEPSIRSLQSKVADIQSKIEEVPELIRKALDPVATAISSLDPTLAEVATAARPVLSMEHLDTEPPKGTDAIEG